MGHDKVTVRLRPVGVKRFDVRRFQVAPSAFSRGDKCRRPSTDVGIPARQCDLRYLARGLLSTPRLRRHTMNRTTLAAAIAFATLAAATPAQAGVRVGIHIGNDRPGYYERGDSRGRSNVGRIAFDNGYRDGLREGEKDDRRDDRYNYRDEGRYRDGDSGYRREYGPRYEYVSAYRRGFEEGYRQGYSNRRGQGRYDGRGNGRYDRR